MKRRGWLLSLAVFLTLTTLLFSSVAVLAQGRGEGVTPAQADAAEQAELLERKLAESQEAAARTGKEDEPARSGEGVTPFDFGGPDGFGYLYADSNEADGPVYSWIELSGTAALTISLGDDAGSGAIPLPFSFDFYGTVYTEVYASSNGYINFDGLDLNDNGNNCPVPNASATDPNTSIYMMWDDLDPGDTSDLIYYEHFPVCPHPDGTGACFVVEYANYHHFPGNAAIAGTFEAILWEDGNIILQYLDGGAETGSGSTTGIENAAGDDGLNYACNTGGTLVADLAVCFEHPGSAGSCYVPTQPAINLIKTVGLDPGVCATDEMIAVAAGTEVSYCYRVVNTGAVTLGLHDLVDSELGTILDDFPFNLGPGANVFLTQAVTINTTTVNTATWTAFNAGPTDVVSATDVATVRIATPEPLTCNGAAVAFENGIPLDWTVANNAPGNPVVWSNLAGCGEAGNYAGSGDAACASSDLQGGGSGAYDTELWTNPLDLSAWSQVQLDYVANYHNFGLVDFLDLDVSTDGGSNWVTLLSWNEDHGTFRGTPGEAVSIDLNAYAGQSNVLLRWHYYDPSGNAGSQDWYAQVDDVALTCSVAPPNSIALSKTVGTDPGVCATDEMISVAAGTEVTYCYEVENSGGVTLGLHDLVDSELGTILSGFPFSLTPGASVFITQAATINVATVNTATWTAYNTGPTDVVSATDTAIVNVSAPEPLLCNGPTVEFENGIPLDWTVANNAPGNPVVWSNLAGCEEAGNYTGGAGDAACASSDLQGGGSGLYDTELWSNPIDLSGWTQAQVDYLSNYQNFAGVDFLDLDVSTDGGTNWTTLLSWNEDHPAGGLRSGPGEAVSVNLDAYAGEPSVILRWHYYDPTGPDTSDDWYAQVDAVSLTCDVGTPNTILLTKTVGTDPGTCAASDSTWVAAGTEVTYCYTVENTGGITLGLHDLVDSELGTILDDFAFNLVPGATVFLTQAATLNATTVNTATWTAFNAGPTEVTSDTDTALVTVSPVGPAEPLACNGTPVAFETGLPADWELVDNTGGAGINWTVTSAAECGIANLTNGSGEAACADSDAAGSGSPPYDTELRSNIFDLSSATAATLNVAAYYRDLNIGSNDQFAIEVWDGFVWNAELIWDESHQPEDIALNLDGYAGLSQVQVRFRYYGNGWDWYAQVDDVGLDCTEEPRNPAIALTMTVGTADGVCAATDNLAVPMGTDVYYCYTVENTGNITFSTHDLTDSELGVILSGFAFDLLPGAVIDTVAAGLTVSATINATTVSTGTWVAYNAAIQDEGRLLVGNSATGVDSATVIVEPPTAVTLGRVESRQGLLPQGMLLLAALAATALTALAVGRRRRLG